MLKGPIHPTLLDLVTQIIFGKEYMLWSPSLWKSLQLPLTSSLLDPNLLLSTLYSDTLRLCYFHNVRDQFFHCHTKQKAKLYSTNDWWLYYKSTCQQNLPPPPHGEKWHGPRNEYFKNTIVYENSSFKMVLLSKVISSTLEKVASVINCDTSCLVQEAQSTLEKTRSACARSI
jgi:hypothetical protein